jgi:hypothetical protein
MKGFYFMFACAVFGLFCLLQFRGTSWDRNQRTPKPKYYSYRGGSSGGYVGSSSRSYYSHK